MDFFSKYDQTPVELVTFTEEILNEKLRFCVVLKPLVNF